VRCSQPRGQPGLAPFCLLEGGKGERGGGAHLQHVGFVSQRLHLVCQLSSPLLLLLLLPGCGRLGTLLLLLLLLLLPLLLLKCLLQQGQHLLLLAQLQLHGNCLGGRGARGSQLRLQLRDPLPTALQLPLQPRGLLPQLLHQCRLRGCRGAGVAARLDAARLLRGRRRLRQSCGSLLRTQALSLRGACCRLRLLPGRGCLLLCRGRVRLGRSQGISQASRAGPLPIQLGVQACGLTAAHPAARTSTSSRVRPAWGDAAAAAAATGSATCGPSAGIAAGSQPGLQGCQLRAQRGRLLLRPALLLLCLLRLGSGHAQLPRGFICSARRQAGGQAAVAAW